MPEQITIKDIKIPRKLAPASTYGEGPKRLIQGTTFEISYPKEKARVTITVSLDADPKEGKILQSAPLALAVAEFRASQKNGPIDPEKGVVIKFGSVHQEGKITLFGITDPPPSDLVKS